MNPTNDPIVVTGIGVVTAAGVGAGALLDALEGDRFCGVPWTGALPVEHVGICRAPIPAHPDFPDDRKADLAFVAAREALACAGGWDHIAPERRAVFLGTGLSSVTPVELETDLYPHLNDEGRFDRTAMARDLSADRGAPRRHMPARVTAGLRAELGAKGPAATSFSACAAAAQAIGEGLFAIRRGEADMALVGGHDSMIHPLGMLSFVVLGALSPTRCRPFDGSRDGFMIGEGAGMLVLERASAAAARGAEPLAVLAGVGSSVDAWNATAPHPEGAGAALSMRRALKDASMAPEAVDYVNCHGTGTPLGDRAECAAVVELFGERRMPISTIKGALGHTIAAAGAVEAVVSVLAIQNGFLPGTVGHGARDPALPVDVVERMRPVRPRVVVSNSFGFGGQNCTLVFASAVPLPSA
jgi:3-oxoacyl-[acyl-carrier-protein] synthase II